jgi:thiol-disulfide isomerase/thioredoxin
MEVTTSYAEFSDVISSNEGVLLYMSSPGCSICHALLPRVKTLLREFPDVTAVHADTAEAPGISGQYTIFTAPALLFFVHGKEVFRMARFIPIDELKENILNSLKMI